MMHSGSFTPSQRSIHNVVNAMVEAGIALVVEGSSFTAASARHSAGRRPRLQRR
jgi:Xaa-Pro aminopeptidase